MLLAVIIPLFPLTFRIILRFFPTQQAFPVHSGMVFFLAINHGDDLEWASHGKSRVLRLGAIFLVEKPWVNARTPNINRPLGRSWGHHGIPWQNLGRINISVES